MVILYPFFCLVSAIQWVRCLQPIVIEDAYKCEYFDCKVDLKTGFKSRSIMCLPVMAVRPQSLSMRWNKGGGWMEGGGWRESGGWSES